MTFDAWVSQFVDFSSANSFMQDLTAATILVVAVTLALSFLGSLLTGVFRTGRR